MPVCVCICGSQGSNGAKWKSKLMIGPAPEKRDRGGMHIIIKLSVMPTRRQPPSDAAFSGFPTNDVL